MLGLLRAEGDCFLRAGGDRSAVEAIPAVHLFAADYVVATAVAPVDAEVDDLCAVWARGRVADARVVRRANGTNTIDWIVVSASGEQEGAQGHYEEEFESLLHGGEYRGNSSEMSKKNLHLGLPHP